MTQIIKTTFKQKDFIFLVKKLDAYLKIVDGEDHNFYNQFNSIDVLDHVVVAYINNIPVGCGAFKKFDKNTVEIKRMYVEPTHRGTKIASKILNKLEVWAKELDFKKCILETGKRQVEAVAFYKKSNYNKITNFGQYAKMENSVCFEKTL